MSHQTVLSEYFTEMHKIASSVLQQYEQLAQSANNPELQDQFDRLSRDEYKQIQLTVRLIEILEE